MPRGNPQAYDNPLLKMMNQTPGEETTMPRAPDAVDVEGATPNTAGSNRTKNRTKNRTDPEGSDPKESDSAESSRRVPKEFIDALVQQESGGDPNAVSSAGAVGLTQTMPHTARDPGFGVDPIDDRTDPQESRRFARDYFGAMMDEFEDPKLALMAFNWGPSNVQQWMEDGGDPSQIPDETQQYVESLLPVARKTMEDTPVETKMVGKKISKEDRKNASDMRETAKKKLMVEALKNQVSQQDNTQVAQKFGTARTPSDQDPLRPIFSSPPNQIQ